MLLLKEHEPFPYIFPNVERTKCIFHSNSEKYHFILGGRNYFPDPSDEKTKAAKGTTYHPANN